MRSILIIFGTIILIAIGFFAYLWFQNGTNPPLAQDNAQQAIVTTPASRPTEVPDPNHINGAGTGQNAWMRNIDEKTGLLSNEFRASKYEPRKDGTIDVTDPEAKFYLGSTEPRQMLVIRGKRGKVFVPDSGNTRSNSPSMGMKGSSEAPSRGQLKDVTLMLYDTANSPEPTLTCTMDNASFDQEIFRVYTEAFEHNGKMVAADEVPVQVRGVDYDFDGRGLDLHWNERDRRLQQLEIAHGERLVVKHPGALQAKSGGGATTKPTAPTSFVPDRMFDVLPVMLASADPASAGQAVKENSKPAAAKKGKKPSTEPVVAPVKIERDKNAPIFRATFFDNVRIVQGDEQLATAKIMHVDFLMENSSTTKPTTQESTVQDQTAPAPMAPATNEPKSITAAKKKSNADAGTNAKSQATTPTAQKPADGAASGKHVHHAATAPTTNTTVASTAPGSATSAPATTQPDQPVTIYWTGKLDVTPLDAAMPDPPKKDDSIVTLLGDPVVLTHTGSRVDAASVRFRTGTNSVLMESSPTVPMVVMHDVNGSIIHTPNLQYDGLSNIAVLRGASQADLVMASNTSATQPADANAAPATAPTPMHASWTRTCRLYMTGDPKTQLNIDRADIDGDVTIDHPQIKGRSDSLELVFEQVPTTQPAQPAAGQPASTTQPTMESNLKSLLATGGAHYVMVGQGDSKTQTIDCARLALTTAKDDKGGTYARTIDAAGGVHTFSDTQDLKCGTLALKLLPSTQPSDADQQQANSDTASVGGSSTTVESMTADQDVHATTTDGNSATCDRLTMDTKSGVREIVLIGEPMAHVQQKDSTISGPIIRIDPDSNKAYVAGAGAMHAVQQSASGKPQPIDVTWTGDMNANGDQNVININDHVAIHSVSSDGTVNDATADRLKMVLMDDPKASSQPTTQQDNSPMAKAGFGNTNFFKNKVAQTVYLNDHVNVTSVLYGTKGNVVRRTLLQTSELQYWMQTKMVYVPVPGQMLVQDLGKAPTTQAAQQPLGDMSGATAFEWQRGLKYVDSEHRMTMAGDVHVNHQSSGDSQPFDLHAQSIVADLEPVPTTQEDSSASTDTTAPATTQSATTKGSGEGKMRLKHVTASDQVTFVSHPIHFEASSIDYDPNSHEMIAHGSDRARAQMFDDKGEASSSFMELRYNTQTGQTQSTDLRATISR